MDESTGIPEPRRPDDVERLLTEPMHWAAMLAELYEWSLPALTAGSGVPVFGSAAWCALEDDDPRKTFAAVRAALAWWTGQLHRAEQSVADHVASSHAVSAAEDWSRIASLPSYAELERRRRRT